MVQGIISHEEHLQFLVTQIDAELLHRIETVIIFMQIFLILKPKDVLKNKLSPDWEHKISCVKFRFLPQSRFAWIQPVDLVMDRASHCTFRQAIQTFRCRSSSPDSAWSTRPAVQHQDTLVAFGTILSAFEQDTVHVSCGSLRCSRSPPHAGHMI